MKQLIFDQLSINRSDKHSTLIITIHASIHSNCTPIFMESWPFLATSSNKSYRHYFSSVMIFDFIQSKLFWMVLLYFSIILGAFGREANGDEQLYFQMKQGA